jgi:alcohol dehydrogenase (cytochrome c)
VLTTGCNLVFWRTPEGHLKAADAGTGKVVWQCQTGSGVVAPPVTRMQEGEQYVSVVSGWGSTVPLWGGEVAKKVPAGARRHGRGVQDPRRAGERLAKAY